MITELLLSGLFTDHMVLQRGRANPIWGQDRPAQVVRVEVTGQQAAPVVVSVTAGSDGSWRLELPELPPGGPYRLRVSGSSERILEDVAVGEVWLVSGQSNMEWPLLQTQNADAEIAVANHPSVRTIRIPKLASRRPVTAVVSEWQTCSTETAGQFSAIGYYFGRDLSKALGVPVGIINSSWGGTRIEAWVSEQGLSPVMPVAQELAALEAQLRDIDRIRAEHGKTVAAWERENYAQDSGRAAETATWSSRDLDETGWRPLRAGMPWQAQGWKHHGASWYRLWIDLPAQAEGNDLELALGLVDDFDWTFFNGEQIGANPVGTPEAYAIERRYNIPGRLVKAGRNLIAIRIFDQVGDGGLLGPDSSRWVRSKIDKAPRLPLSATWLAKEESRIPLIGNDIWSRLPPTPAVLQKQEAIASLYNGMIHPVQGYGLAGFLWYQGESNVGQPDAYEARFRALIRDWRSKWGGGTHPFIFAQLASYEAGPGWPLLREAQDRLLGEPGTGMVVCFDIGDARDIHPRNKRDVGGRMALVARRLAYGDSAVQSEGPRFESVSIRGDSAFVRFNHAEGLKTRDGAAGALGFELAGEDGEFRPAMAVIQKSGIMLRAPGVQRPVKVRYAFKDYCEVNLVNGAGLPAVPFRTDI